MPVIELSYMPGGKLIVAPHAITAIHLSPISSGASPSSLIYMGDRSFCVAGTPDQIREQLWPKPAVQIDETVSDFIAAEAKKGPKESVTVADFYASYRSWCNENGQDDLYCRRLVEEMQRLGFKTHNGRARFFTGISVPSYRLHDKR